MISTLLFDLDDTLLGNDMGSFLPGYFARLADSLPPGVDPEQFTAGLVAGIRKLIANTDPTRSLRAIMADQVYPALGGPAENWIPHFNEFFKSEFPQLRGLTRSLPAARRVMAWAHQAGYELVIATSPVFPMAAIQERLRWAGLDDFPYARITAIENSHFTKPHPEYFAEILAHLGRRPDEALVIGNDWSNDILAGAAAGIAQYWIAPDGQAQPASLNGAQPLGTGSLDDFLTWAAAELPNVTALPTPASALPYLLAGNLAAAAGTLEDVAADSPAWQQRPSPEEWSLTEIVCHLRDVDREVNLPRLRLVLESDNPFISGADTDPWAVQRDYQSQSGHLALREFVDARKQLYGLLAGLPASAWLRPARHSLFGPTHLAEIVGWTLDHDRIHLEQLRLTRGKVALEERV